MSVVYSVNVADICIDIDEYDVQYDYGLYVRTPWLSENVGMVHSEVARWGVWSGSGEVDQSPTGSEWSKVPSWWYATN